MTTVSFLCGIAPASLMISFLITSPDAVFTASGGGFLRSNGAATCPGFFPASCLASVF